ncbi:MAG: large conductance mechanosensitive channel protein MscL, partial [Alsobacter sp.]
MLDEFKSFAMKGNVVDLAVGVVIGAAFGRIVDSIVGDVFMPIIGAIVGGLDFSNYYIPLSSAVKTGMSYGDAKKAGAVLGYGQFLTIALNFLIIAAALFLVVKLINRVRAQDAAKAAAEPPPPPTTEEKL